MANPPNTVVAVLGPDGQFTDPWRRFFQALTAASGVQGPPGPAGPTGPAGPPGSDTSSLLAALAMSELDSEGLIGAPGLIGPPGRDGDDGQDGQSIPGPVGPMGAPGQMGAPGFDGLDGEDGVSIPGPSGARGPIGLQGLPGLDGSDGEDGQSIIGPAGPAGIAGLLGAPGLDGLDGEDGQIGAPGLSVQGPRGFTGAPGLDGQDGDDFGGMPMGNLYLPLAGGTMGGAIITPNGTAAAPSLNLGGTNGGLYTDGTDVLLSVGGTERVDFAAAGPSFLRSGATPTMIGLRTDATLGNNITTFAIDGQGFNSTGATLITWSQLIFKARTSTTGSEVGSLYFFTFHGAALTQDLSLDSGNLYAGTVSGGNQITSGTAWVGVQAASYTRSVPATGFSITIGNGDSFRILDPAGVLATGTITMPASPTDGHEVTVSSSQQITALTVQANTGQTMDGGISAALFAANSFAKWKYVLSVTTWYRVG